MKTTPFISRSENDLKSLPNDLTLDMPALLFLNVEQNAITSWNEETFAPLNKEGTYVNMLGNAFSCVCNQSFLLAYPERWTYYICCEPQALRNKYIKSLTEAELCTNST